MKNLLLLLAFFTAFLSAAQTNSSAYALVYKPTFGAMKHYMKDYNSTALLRSVEMQQPVDTLWGGSLEDARLAPGLYVIVHAIGGDLELEILNNNPWSVATSKQRSTFNLRIFDPVSGDMPTDLEVIEERKGGIRFKASANAYTFKTLWRDYGDVLIRQDSVFVLASWETDDYYYGYRPRLFRRFSYLFNEYQREQHREWKREYKGMKYIALNKPMFRVGDTLKSKAFILKENGNPYKKPLVVELNYYDYQKGKTLYSTLDTLSPYRPGAYTYSFEIPDSLLGKRPELKLLDGKKELASANFEVKDYTLDKITFSADWVNKNDKAFVPGKPMRLEFSAKDDNGLAAMDGYVNLVVTESGVHLPFLQQVVLVPSVLLDTTLFIDATGQGVFTIPESVLPKAATNIHVKLLFVGADGESKTDYFSANWTPKRDLISLTFQDSVWVFEADSSFTNHEKANIEFVVYQSRSGVNRITHGHQILEKKQIRLPFTFKRSLPASWEISIDGVEQDIAPQRNYNAAYPISAITEKGVAIWYENDGLSDLYAQIKASGKTIVYQGFLSKDTLWLPSNVDYYEVLHFSPQLYDAQVRQDFIPVNPKVKPRMRVLDLNAVGPTTIYPGDTATWHLALTENKKPVDDFDLLAMAYKERQFGRFPIEANTLWPKTKSSKTHRVKNVRFDLDFSNHTTTVREGWSEKLGVDSLPQFKYLHTASPVTITYLPLPDSLTRPQFAPFVVKEGRQELVVTYTVDGKLKYFEEVSGGNFTSEVRSGKQSVVIRGLNYQLELPHVHFKNGFKTEIAIDLDRLPDSIVFKEMPRSFTEEEQAVLHRDVLRIFVSEQAVLRQGQQEFNLAKAYKTYRVGPFENDVVSVISENKSIDFLYEPGYSYAIDLEKRIIEKTSFSTWDMSAFIQYHDVRSEQFPGDFAQLPSPEEIIYVELDSTEKYMRVNNKPEFGLSGNLSIHKEKGGFQTYYMYNHDRNHLYMHFEGQYQRTSSMWQPGTYTLFALSEDHMAAIVNSFQIKEDFTSHVYLQGSDYEESKKALAILDSISARLATDSVFEMPFEDVVLRFANGSRGSLSGTVVDKRTGETIPFANVTIKSKGVLLSGTITDLDGNYVLRDITPGYYTVEFSFIGYASYSVTGVAVHGGRRKRLDAAMSEETSMLQEVVVVAQQELIETGKTSTVITAMEIRNMPFRGVGQLAAMTPGVASSGDGEAINIRGGRGNTTMYYIDGVAVRGDVNLPRDAINSVEVIAGGLPGQYGDATGGVVNAKTSEAEGALSELGSRGGNMRSRFSDYAFFIPDVTTDENGKAVIKVKYPDDVANWGTTFIGMGKGKRYALARTETKGFSKVSAQLAAPRYLVLGDSCLVIGKSLNYLDTTIRVQHQFSINSKTVLKENRDLTDVLIDRLPVIASGPMQLEYTMRLQNGFVDGEKRELPVVPRGLKKQEGAFFLLRGDTSVTYTADSTGVIRVGMMQTTTDFVLEEAEEQLRYVHNCNEQMASKLKAILAIQKIDEAAGRKFHRSQEVERLIGLLLKNRNNDMLWGWWGQQETDPWMTTYVIDALLQAVKQGYAVDINPTLTKAVNRLTWVPKKERVDLLYVLGKGGVEAPYSYFLVEIPFDSLSAAGQIKYAVLAEAMDLPYDTLAIKKYLKSDLLGNTYFTAKKRQHYFESNIYLSLLGGEWLKTQNDSINLSGLYSFLLFNRGQHYWNTVDRASAIELFSFQIEKESTSEKSLVLHWGDGSETILDTALTMFKKVDRSVTIRKAGNGVVYASASQSRFYPAPTALTDMFVVETYFEVDGERKDTLEVGRNVQMRVSVEVKHMAEYVMLEIPIPASCTVNENLAHFYWRGRSYQRELKGDKLYIYLDKLTAGNHTFSVSLLPRYAGGFVMNPVNVEPMYFPTKSGNNETERVYITAVAQ